MPSEAWALTVAALLLAAAAVVEVVALVTGPAGTGRSRLPGLWLTAAAMAALVVGGLSMVGVPGTAGFGCALSHR